MFNVIERNRLIMSTRASAIVMIVSGVGEPGDVGSRQVLSKVAIVLRPALKCFKMRVSLRTDAILAVFGNVKFV